MPEFRTGNYMNRNFLDNSRIWYASVVPILGLFIEVFATSKPFGVLVWAMAVIMLIAACLLDRKYVMAQGIDLSKVPAITAILPPVYMIKRCKLTSTRQSPSIVWVIMTLFALLFNGFTVGASMTEDDMVSQVRDNYLMNVSGFSERTELDLIGDILEEHAGGKLAWTAEYSGEKVVVSAVCKSKKSDESEAPQTKGEVLKELLDNSSVSESADENDDKNIIFSIEFEMNFDGYSFGEIKIISITDGGKTYDGKKAAKHFTDIVDEKEDKKSDK